MPVNYLWNYNAGIMQKIYCPSNLICYNNIEIRCGLKWLHTCVSEQIPAISALLFSISFIIHIFPIISIDFMYEQDVFSYLTMTKGK